MAFVMNGRTASAIADAQTQCYHCGLPVAAATHYRVLVDQVERAVCCPGCQAVVESIIGSGLGNYYRYRENTSNRAADNSANSISDEFDYLDRADFNRQWLTRPAQDAPQYRAASSAAAQADDDLIQCELSIGGMHCAACVWLLEQRLTRLPGVVSAQIDFDAQRASVCWHQNRQKLSAICRAIAAIGYQPQPYSRDRSERQRQREQRQALRRLGVAGIAMMQVGMLALGLYAGSLDGIEAAYRNLLRWSSLLVTVPVLLYSAQPFFIGAWRGLRARQPGMDLPVAVALSLAFVASVWATLRNSGEVYFDSVTMFVFLLLGSRYLELRARHYRSSFSSDFFSLLPHAAIRVEAGGLQRMIPVEQLQVGDTVLVRSGEVLPADGYLLDAQCRINEAALTGEYMPVHKLRGAQLLAGSVNSEQALTMRVGAVGAQLRIAAIHAITRQAQHWKPRLAQLADRLAGKLVLAILALAALTYAGWYWYDAPRAFWTALSVLVVSCPCALSLATPLAITTATNALRRAGLLVTRADAWEQLPRITDVVFDKTGTLSEGCISIVAIEPCGARSAAICREIAAALEAGSNHPIAAAFAAPTAHSAQDCRQYAGRGVEGYIAGRRYRIGDSAFALELSQAKSGDQNRVSARSGQWILLADDSGAVCWFRLQDRLRADAEASVATLRQRGLRLHLLSGDRSGSAAELAAQLRIERVCSGASPEQKLDYVQSLQRAGRRVLMVGDGINDIPVLAAADVSVAMRDASQLAKTSADCLLLSAQLDRLPLLLSSAAKTQTIIRQNLAWALLYNALAIPLAAFGLIAPWLAALGMSLSSLLVTLNALRLQNFAAANHSADVRQTLDSERAPSIERQGA